MIRYAAIGDSFTEGLGDTLPDGTERGWADLVAAGLAAGAGQTIEYANFAIRGRLLEPIVTDQLEAALSLSPQPTLLSLNGGGNDMMRPGGDMRRLVELTERAVKRCTAAGVRMVLLSGADPSGRLPLGSLVRRRGEALTGAIADLAGRSDLVFVDMFHDTEIRRAEYWGPDRLHLNSAGHRREPGAHRARPPDRSPRDRPRSSGAPPGDRRGALLRRARAALGSAPVAGPLVRRRPHRQVRRLDSGRPDRPGRL
jgi:lysophospholipase L1-like esterase